MWRSFGLDLSVFLLGYLLFFFPLFYWVLSGGPPFRVKEAFKFGSCWLLRTPCRPGCLSFLLITNKVSCFLLEKNW